MNQTVKIRIAVAVDPDGQWDLAPIEDGCERESMHAAMLGLDDGAQGYIFEKDLPLPTVQVISPAVEEAQ